MPENGGRDLLVGIDAGTSVIKAVAFTLAGHQIAAAAVPNRYGTRPDGSAFQDLDETWADCAQTLRSLGGRIDNLARRWPRSPSPRRGTAPGWSVQATNR